MTDQRPSAAEALTPAATLAGHLRTIAPTSHVHRYPATTGHLTYDLPEWLYRDLLATLDATRPAEPPEGTRLVLMSEELALALGADRVEWGEPDVNGWYTPTPYARLADKEPSE